MTEFELNGATGFTQVEVAARLGAEGYNELPAAARHAGDSLEVIRDPMFLLLAAAGAIYLLFAIALAVMVALLHVLLRGAWLDGILAGITLAMAILPEEFPVVLTVFLALGAWRNSKSRVLTRRVPAIARSIGLKLCDEVITGIELAAMDDAELRSRMRRVNLCEMREKGETRNRNWKPRISSSEVRLIAEGRFFFARTHHPQNLYCQAIS